MVFLQIAVFLMGLAIVVRTLLSAIYTFVLPRSTPDIIARTVFNTVRRLFELRLRWTDTYEEQDRIMALYAPVALLSLLPIWLTLVLFGYMFMYWSTGIYGWDQDFIISGSSLLTLGFASSPSILHSMLAFSEAIIGLILVALLIAYLPTMYAAFSRREVAVTQLASRAGTPPSAVEMILRAHRIGGLDSLYDFWKTWETLFAEIEESHTSLAALVFFRSPLPEHSWLTASGAVLDTASLYSSTVDMPRQPQAELCIRAGYLALRRIADFFDIPHNPEPNFPDEPISIARDEYDEMYSQLASHGVPLKANSDQSWQDFAGWRVNYDRVLVDLCALVMAPYAPWSSDRSAPLSLQRSGSSVNSID